jgi:hypothetical protein
LVWCLLSGGPPRDPAARAAYDAAKAARTADPNRQERRGGYRPNGGRRKGDKARVSETAIELAERHIQELATLTARYRREMRAFVARNKKTQKAGANDP